MGKYIYEWVAVILLVASIFSSCICKLNSPNLGNEKKALKELKKANVSREEKTIVAFSNCCCKGFESENPFFSELEDEQLVPKKGRGKGSNKKKRKKSLVSMIKKLLRFLKWVISYTNQGSSYRKNGLPWSFHILCGYLQTDKS